jgi:glyoxylase-like metal-dependent hydrolase (beta-lactamase superfamily II)
MTRRSLLAASPSLAAAQNASAAAPFNSAPFNLERVADGVWAAIANPAVIGNCNGAVFELSDGLLIVDTHARPGAAAAMMAELRKSTKKPVKYIVLTHIHGDHVQGISYYRKTAPQAVFIAHENTRKRMAEGGNPVPGILANQEKALRAAEERAAKASGEELKFVQREIRERREFVKEMTGVTLDLPAVTLSRDLVIHDKLQEIHILHRGFGHTDGDLVVYSPQRKVIATADLAVSTTPNIGPWIYHWPRTLVAVGQDCGFEHVIPGHGGVQQGRQTFARFANYLEELLLTVETKRRQRKSLEDVRKEVTPASLPSLAGEYGRYIGEQIFRYRMQPPSVQSGSQALTSAVSGNAEQIYNVLSRL